MKKANILIEALISLALLVTSSLLISQIFTNDRYKISIIDPFNDLSKDCKVQCVIKKLIP